MPLGIQLVIAVVVGLGLGFIFGWLYARGRAVAPADDRLANELRQQLARREAELGQIRESITLAKTETAKAQASQAGAEKLLAEQQALHERALAEAKSAQEKALADLIVRLPGDRFIIVDAKVPELDFLSALESADATKRAESLAAHVAKLKNTIKALADRDYPSQFPNALDYVVLFLPAESLFSAALEGDRDLIVWAAQKRILLTTPASLIALLRSVSVSWQQHAQTENARAIAEAAQELFSRVAVFTEHLEKIGDGLAKATDAFNKASASYQSRVRPAGDRLVELSGGIGGKALAKVEPLEATLRLPPA
jgi:DNA anti-recombination protein RmuC